MRIERFPTSGYSRVIVGNYEILARNYGDSRMIDIYDNSPLTQDEPPIIIDAKDWPAIRAAIDALLGREP